jgi:hypothetical protein
MPFTCFTVGWSLFLLTFINTYVFAGHRDILLLGHINTFGVLMAYGVGLPQYSPFASISCFLPSVQQQTPSETWQPTHT